MRVNCKTRVSVSVEVEEGMVEEGGMRDVKTPVELVSIDDGEEDDDNDAVGEMVLVGVIWPPIVMKLPVGYDRLFEETPVELTTMFGVEDEGLDSSGVELEPVLLVDDVLEWGDTVIPVSAVVADACADGGNNIPPPSFAPVVDGVVAVAVAVLDVVGVVTVGGV